MIGRGPTFIEWVLFVVSFVDKSISHVESSIYFKIVDINFMHRNMVKIIVIISCTALKIKPLIQFHSPKPNSNTFYPRKMTSSFLHVIIVSLHTL